LQIYYIDKIPLLNPHNEDHYTTLMTDFNVITFHPDIDYILAADGVHHQLPEYLDLRQSPLMLRQRAVPSCPVALLQGDLASIKQLCGYRIKIGHLPKQVFRVGSVHWIITIGFSGIRKYFWKFFQWTPALFINTFDSSFGFLSGVEVREFSQS